MVEQKSKSLYDSLVKNGYSFGKSNSYEDFKNIMADKEKAEKVYNMAIEDGYTFDPFDQFYKDFGDTTSNNESVTPGQVPAQPNDSVPANATTPADTANVEQATPAPAPADTTQASAEENVWNNEQQQQSASVQKTKLEKEPYISMDNLEDAASVAGVGAYGDDANVLRRPAAVASKSIYYLQRRLYRRKDSVDDFDPNATLQKVQEQADKANGVTGITPEMTRYTNGISWAERKAMQAQQEKAVKESNERLEADEKFWNEHAKPTLDKAEGEEAAAWNKRQTEWEKNGPALNSRNVMGQLAGRAADRPDLGPTRAVNETITRLSDSGELSDYVLSRLGFDTSKKGENTESRPLTEDEKKLFNDKYSAEWNRVALYLQNQIYNEYRRKGAPQNLLTYILGEGFRDSLVGTIATAAINGMDQDGYLREQLRQQGVANWENEHAGSIAQGLKGAVSMTVDAPEFFLGGAIGDALAESAIKGVAKHMFGEAGVEAGTRLMMMKPAWKMVDGALKSSQAFGVYGGMSGFAQSLSNMYDENGNPRSLSDIIYNMGTSIASNYFEEAAKGALIGAAGQGVRLGSGRIADNLAFTGNYKKLFEDAAGFAGNVGLFTGLEAGEAALNGEYKNFHWSSAAIRNAAMFFAMDYGNVLKWPEIYKRYKQNEVDINWTDLDDEAIEQEYGPMGKELIRAITNGLYGKTVKILDDKEVKLGNPETDAMGDDVPYGKKLYADMMSDNRIPLSTKEKLRYIIEGKTYKNVAQEKTYSAKFKEEPDGKFTVSSLDDRGCVIENFRFSTQKEAEKKIAEIQAMALKNNVEAAEMLVVTAKGDNSGIEAIANAQEYVDNVYGKDVTPIDELLNKDPLKYTPEEVNKVFSYMNTLQRSFREQTVDPRQRKIEDATSEDGQVHAGVTKDGKTVFVKDNGQGDAVVTVDPETGEQGMAKRDDVEPAGEAPAEEVLQSEIETYDPAKGAQVGNIVWYKDNDGAWKQGKVCNMGDELAIWTDENKYWSNEQGVLYVLSSGSIDDIQQEHDAEVAAQQHKNDVQGQLNEENKLNNPEVREFDGTRYTYTGEDGTVVMAKGPDGNKKAFTYDDWEKGKTVDVAAEKKVEEDRKAQEEAARKAAEEAEKQRKEQEREAEIAARHKENETIIKIKLSQDPEKLKEFFNGLKNEELTQKIIDAYNARMKQIGDNVPEEEEDSLAHAIDIAKSWVDQDPENTHVRKVNGKFETWEEYRNREGEGRSESLTYIMEKYGENVPEEILNAHPDVLTEETAPSVARDLVKAGIELDDIHLFLGNVLNAKSEAILPFLDEWKQMEYEQKNGATEQVTTPLGETVDANERGRKQINNAIKNIIELGEIDSLEKVAAFFREYGRLMTNVSRGAKMTAKEQKFIEDHLAKLKELGYEPMMKIGDKYHRGMKVDAEFVLDKTKPSDYAVVTGIKTPGVYKDGVMAVAPSIIVTQGPEAEEEGPAKSGEGVGTQNEEVKPVYEEFGDKYYSLDDIDKVEIPEMQPNENDVFMDAVRISVYKDKNAYLAVKIAKRDGKYYAENEYDRGPIHSYEGGGGGPFADGDQYSSAREAVVESLKELYKWRGNLSPFNITDALEKLGVNTKELPTDKPDHEYDPEEGPEKDDLIWVPTKDGWKHVKIEAESKGKYKYTVNGAVKTSTADEIETYRKKHEKEIAKSKDGEKLGAKPAENESEGTGYNRLLPTDADREKKREIGRKALEETKNREITSNDRILEAQDVLREDLIKAIESGDKEAISKAKMAMFDFLSKESRRSNKMYSMQTSGVFRKLSKQEDGANHPASLVSRTSPASREADKMIADFIEAAWKKVDSVSMNGYDMRKEVLWSLIRNMPKGTSDEINAWVQKMYDFYKENFGEDDQRTTWAKSYLDNPGYVESEAEPETPAKKNGAPTADDMVREEQKEAIEKAMTFYEIDKIYDGLFKVNADEDIKELALAKRDELYHEWFKHYVKDNGFDNLPDGITYSIEDADEGEFEFIRTGEDGKKYYLFDVEVDPKTGKQIWHISTPTTGRKSGWYSPEVPNIHSFDEAYAEYKRRNGLIEKPVKEEPQEFHVGDKIWVTARNGRKTEWRQVKIESEIEGTYQYYIGNEMMTDSREDLDAIQKVHAMEVASEKHNEEQTKTEAEYKVGDKVYYQPKGSMRAIEMEVVGVHKDGRLDLHGEYNYMGVGYDSIDPSQVHKEAVDDYYNAKEKYKQAMADQLKKAAESGALTLRNIDLGIQERNTAALKLKLKGKRNTTAADVENLAKYEGEAEALRDAKKLLDEGNKKPEKPLDPKIDEMIADGHRFVYVYGDAGRKQYEAVSADGHTAYPINKVEYDYAIEHGAKHMSDAEIKDREDENEYNQLQKWYIKEFPHHELNDVISRVEEALSDNPHLKQKLDKLNRYKELDETHRERQERIISDGEAYEKSKAEEPKKEQPKFKVDDNRMDELKRKMQERLRHLNIGVDPELFMLGVEYTFGLIERGVRKFADYVSEMRSAFGEATDKYLKQFYEGAKNDPDMPEDVRAELTKSEDVQRYDVANHGKEVKDVAATARETLAEHEVAKETAETEKVNKLVSAIKDGINDANLGGAERLNIVKMRKLAADNGLDLTDIQIQELAERAIVERAKELYNLMLSKNFNQQSLLNAITKLYNAQPTISMRSSQREIKQQYSTPIPMAFCADEFARKVLKKNPDAIGLEPCGGNGMMIFSLPWDHIHANEIDANRLKNLALGGFMEVTTQNALEPFEKKRYDFIVNNPPFGTSSEPMQMGRYSITGLDPKIVVNTLESLKDDGRASIIIGGNTDYDERGVLKGKDNQLLGYLYDNYNVVDVINMSGDLYQRQGTTYPTRMILINGRRGGDASNRQRRFAPLKQFAKAEPVQTFEELLNRINEDERLLESNELSYGMDNHGNEWGNGDRARNEVGTDRLADKGDAELERPAGELGGSAETVPGGQNPSNAHTERGAVERPRGNAVVGGEHGGRKSAGEERPARANAEPGNGLGTRNGNDGREVGQRGNAGQHEPNALPSQGSDSRKPKPADGNTGNATVGNAGETSAAAGVGQRGVVEPKTEQYAKQTGNVAEPKKPAEKKEQEKAELGQQKINYTPTSDNPFTLEAVMPANMAASAHKALEGVAKRHGNIDDWLQKELGYDSKESLYKALAADQIDSVAMAIDQMMSGKGFIIGDMTGIGKGRQAASLIRWANKHGYKPIFITENCTLFSDIYRDLVDIDSPDLKPFILNANSEKNDKGIGDADITDKKGLLVYRAYNSGSKEQREILESGKVPDDCGYVVMSYSQVNRGDETSNGTQSSSASRRRSRRNTDPSLKPRFIRNIAKNNILILDESHNASGMSKTGSYFRSILNEAKGVTFLSATYSKRPDTMPLYAQVTSMGEANVSPEELLNIITEGGLPLMEQMSRQLTESGQLIRRERNMDGVEYEIVEMTDSPEMVKKVRQSYDDMISLMNKIIDYQRRFIDPYIDGKNDEAAMEQTEVKHKPGTRDMGINNTPFASQTYNITKQMMLSLKTEYAAKFADKLLKNGKKVVFTLANTMESSYGDLAPIGGKIEDADFSNSLIKMFNKLFVMQHKEGSKILSYEEFSPSSISPEAKEAYDELVAEIKGTTSGISCTPVDDLIHQLNMMGYTVRELTGRNTCVDYDVNGVGTLRRRGDDETDKRENTRMFNNGEVDVLIINVSGATGISAQSAPWFKDSRQRAEINLQNQEDIDKQIQILGRTDRTGQLYHSLYYTISLPIPAETRQNIMFNNKVKSLSANTTASKKSEQQMDAVPDLLNGYGSYVVGQYIKENPGLMERFGGNMPRTLGWFYDYLNETAEWPKDADDSVARWITGRVALLDCESQDKFYNEVGENYKRYVQYLTETGQNTMDTQELPLRAKTLERRVASPGKHPGGDNPFADNAYLETVEVDVLRKPMNTDEIKKMEAKLWENEGGDGAKHASAIKKTVNDYYAEKRDLLLRNLAKMEEGERADLEKMKERIMARKKLTDEEKQTAIRNAEAEVEERIKTTREDQLSKFDRIVSALNIRFNYFKPGQSVRVPVNFYSDDPTIETEPGLFLGYKMSGKKINPSSISMVFAVLSAERKIEVPMSMTNALDKVNRSTQNFEGNIIKLDTWDKEIPAENREIRYIMTGNIIQAMKDSNGAGRLITYTDIDGNVKNGVMMPSMFDASKFSPKALINQVAREIKNGMNVVSSDGTIRIVKTGADYQIKLHLGDVSSEMRHDHKLLDIVVGNDMARRGEWYNGIVQSKDFDALIDYLADNRVSVDVNVDEDGTISYKDPDIEKMVSADVRPSKMSNESNIEYARRIVDWDQARKQRNEEKMNEAVNGIVESANPDASEAELAATKAGVMAMAKAIGTGNVVFEKQESAAERLEGAKAPELMRKSDGQVLGWYSPDGKIHLTPNGVNANTPLHEYGHPYASAIQNKNPKLWSRIKELLDTLNDGTMEFIKKNYPDLEGDALYRELFARWFGNRGSERLKEDARQAINEGKNWKEKGFVANLFGKIKQAIAAAKKWIVKDILKLDPKKFKNLDDVFDKTYYDLANGYKPEPDGPEGGPKGGKPRNEAMLAPDPSTSAMLQYMKQVRDRLSTTRNSGDVRKLGRELSAYVKENVDAAMAQKMGSRRIKALADEMTKATTTEELNRPIMTLEQIMNEAKLAFNATAMYRMITKKVRGLNDRGVAKGMLVDPETQDVLQQVRQAFKTTMLTAVDKDLEIARTEARELRTQAKDMAGVDHYDQITKAMRAADPALDDVCRNVDIATKKVRDLEDDRDKLQQQNQIDELKTVRAKMLELETKILSNEKLTDEEKKLYDSILPIREKIAEFRDIVSGPYDAVNDCGSLEYYQNIYTKLVKEAAEKRPDGERPADITGTPHEAKWREYDRIMADADNVQVQILLRQEQAMNTSATVGAMLAGLLKDGADTFRAMKEKERLRKSQLIAMALTSTKKAAVGLEGSTAKKPTNSAADKFLTWSNKPLYSFEYLIQTIDQNHYLGKGPLYEYFVHDAKTGIAAAESKMDTRIRMYNQALKDKIDELWHGKWDEKDLRKYLDEELGVKLERNISKEDIRKAVRNSEDGINHLGQEGDPYYIEHKTRDNALYLWMAWRQLDGRAKMEAGGYTQKTVDQIEAALDPKVIELAKWVTDEFYPELRKEYDKTYVELFQTHMADIPHYFPLSISKSHIAEKGELGKHNDYSNASLVVPNIIERKPNLLPLDEFASFMQIFKNYGHEMEQWNAMARILRDLNTLRACRYFKENLEANDKGSFNRLFNSAEVATWATYVRDDDKTQDLINKLITAKATTAISFRFSTAAKQVLSYPLYYQFVEDPKCAAELTYNLMPWRWYPNFKWCMENIPSFRNRREAGTMGLEGLDEKTFLNTVMEKYRKAGFAANKFVDMMTIAGGARAIYNQSMRKYRKLGMSEANAHEQAVIDATIAFNTTQQSSEPWVSSPMQKSGKALDRSLTMFQNSVISYRRILGKAAITLQRAKYLMEMETARRIRHGENPDTARAEAKKRALRASLGAIGSMATIAVASMLWGMGGNTSGLLNQSEEDRNKIWRSLILGMTVQGATYGSVLNTIFNGYDWKTVPYFDDFWNKIGDIWSAEDIEDVLTLPSVIEILDYAAQSGLGFDATTWDNIFKGIIGGGDKRWELDKGDALDWYLFMNASKSDREGLANYIYRKEGPLEFGRQMEKAWSKMDKKRGLKEFAMSAIRSNASELSTQDVTKIVDGYLKNRDEDFFNMMEDMKEFEKEYEKNVKRHEEDAIEGDYEPTKEEKEFIETHAPYGPIYETYKELKDGKGGLRDAIRQMKHKAVYQYNSPDSVDKAANTAVDSLISNWHRVLDSTIQIPSAEE